jgi:hypothetical protein
MSDVTREVIEVQDEDKFLHYRELSCTAYGFYHCCFLISICYMLLSIVASFSNIEPSIEVYLNIYILSLCTGILVFVNRYFVKLKEYKYN